MHVLSSVLTLQLLQFGCSTPMGVCCCGTAFICVDVGCCEHMSCESHVHIITVMMTLDVLGRFELHGRPRWTRQCQQSTFELRHSVRKQAACPDVLIECVYYYCMSCAGVLGS